MTHQSHRSYWIGKKCWTCFEATKVTVLKVYLLLSINILPTALVVALLQVVPNQQVKRMLHLHPYRLLMMSNFLRWSRRVPAPISTIISSAQGLEMWNGFCIPHLWRTVRYLGTSIGFPSIGSIECNRTGLSLWVTMRMERGLIYVQEIRDIKNWLIKWH